MARVRRGADSGQRRTWSWSPTTSRSAGVRKRFAYQAARFVVGAGVVGGEHAGQGGLGVVGGHADGVVDAFAFGGEAHGVGTGLPEGDLGGDRLGRGGEAVDLGVCGGERFEELGGGASAFNGGLAFGRFAFAETVPGVAEVASGQRVDEPVGTAQAGECFHPSAHRLDLRRPIEPEQSLVQADPSQLVQWPAQLAPQIGAQLLARHHRLSLRLVARPAQPEDLGAMHSAATMQAADGIRFTPPLHRLGPLLGHVVQGEALKGTDELAVNDPRRQRIELPRDGRYPGLIEQR